MIKHSWLLEIPMYVPTFDMYICSVVRSDASALSKETWSATAGNAMRSPKGDWDLEPRAALLFLAGYLFGLGWLGPFRFVGWMIAWLPKKAELQSKSTKVVEANISQWNVPQKTATLSSGWPCSRVALQLSDTDINPTVGKSSQKVAGLFRAMWLSTRWCSPSAVATMVCCIANWWTSWGCEIPSRNPGWSVMRRQKLPCGPSVSTSSSCWFHLT